MYAAKPQHDRLEDEQLQGRRSVGRSELVQNAFMMEETKDRFTLTAHEEHFVGEERRAEEGETEEI
jgi:hypothetical protein